MRARVGYANDNWLFYGTGGLALLGAKTTLTAAGGVAACGGDFSKLHQPPIVRPAWCSEVGSNTAFTANLSAKLEYLYITAASLDVSQHGEIRAGLNYRFGGM